MTVRAVLAIAFNVQHVHQIVVIIVVLLSPMLPLVWQFILPLALPLQRHVIACVTLIIERRCVRRFNTAVQHVETVASIKKI